MVDERFVLDTLSMLVNVSLKCCDDEVSDVAHKLVFEILSSKAGPLHGQMLRMCSLLCTPSSAEFAKTVVGFMDRAYFSASDGSKSWLVQASRQLSTRFTRLSYLTFSTGYSCCFQFCCQFV